MKCKCWIVLNGEEIFEGNKWKTFLTEYARMIL